MNIKIGVQTFISSKNTILYVSMHNFKPHLQLCHHCSGFPLDSNMGMKMISFFNQTPVVISHLSWYLPVMMISAAYFRSVEENKDKLRILFNGVRIS